MIQQALATIDTSRGTIGEKALAATVLLRRDLDAVRDQAAQAVKDAAAAFDREQQALRDVNSNIASAVATERAAHEATKKAHATEIGALEATHAGRLIALENAVKAAFEAHRP